MKVVLLLRIRCAIVEGVTEIKGGKSVLFARINYSDFGADFQLAVLASKNIDLARLNADLSSICEFNLSKNGHCSINNRIDIKHPLTHSASLDHRQS